MYSIYYMLCNEKCTQFRVRHVYVTHIIFILSKTCHAFLKLNLTISAANLINTKLRKIFLFRYKLSLQHFIEAVFVYQLFYNLRNVGPHPGSPMNYRLFCNIIIYNGKVRIKYLSRIMMMNSQVAANEIQQWCG